MATNQLHEVVQTLRRVALPQEEAGRTDGQLLDHYVRSREEAAFAALVRRHGAMVWGVCRRVLRSHQDAEDAFQGAFLVLVRKASSIVPRDMVANWLYGVAHQTALKARAVAARRGAREKQVMEMPEPVFEPQDRRDDLQALLDLELSRMPDKYRAVLVLCDLEGKTRKEAGRHFHLPEGTVASRLATARALLAKRLSRRGLTASTAAVTAALAQNAASACVPPALTTAAIKAANLLAAGQAAAGVISTQAVALAEGVLKTMLLSKLKVTSVVVLLVAVVGVGAAAFMKPAPAAHPANPPTTEKQPQDAKPGDPPPKQKQAVAARGADAAVKETRQPETLPTTVSGVLKAVDAATGVLTVVHREGEDAFTAAKDVKITIDDKPADLARLPVGAIVTLSRFVDAKTAGAVRAGGRSYFGAPVKAVDAARNTVTIKDRDDEKTFTVTRESLIWIDGKPASLASVPTGAFVNLDLAADQQTVRHLGAAGPDLGGCGGSLISAVDAAKGTITFDDKAMAEVAGKTFTVASDALVSVDGKPGTLAAVPVGCYVSVSLRIDGQTVGQLRAQGPSNVCDCGGSPVTAIDVEKRTITFDDKARAEVAGKTFTLAKDAIVGIDGKPGTLAAVPVGSNVQMNLWTDRQTVGFIFAQGPAVNGVGLVKAVDVENNLITVEDKTYPVAKDANILFDGATCKLSGVRTGEYVSLRLCVDQKTVGTIFHSKAP
jgi:RNA polymerase sigma factor (sigma-70 family)